MSLLDTLTGGKSSEATDAADQGLQAYDAITTPDLSQLTLPELQQYAVSQNMTPAQMQAFLQQQNALATENTDQQGIAAQKAAISQLANVANAGAAGTPVEQAQIAQALQQSNQNLAGQRGAIDQAAEARGVPPGLLQAALSQQNAGQDAQAANQAALQAQSQAYQTALGAMASGANAGQALQGQQNTQANTVAQAQNAMQQFNAANQQNASQVNAANQQQANLTNTNNANQVGQANTGLANQRTVYNAGLPQQMYEDQLQKAAGITNAGGQAANTATGQGQQQAGLIGGLLGAAGTVAGGAFGGPVGAAIGSQAGQGFASGPPQGTNTAQYSPLAQGYGHGGVVEPYAGGGMCSTDGPMMKGGGMIPGKAKVQGDSKKNDVVPIRVSPGEAVVPRTAVQQHPIETMQLLRGAKPGGPPPQGIPQPPIGSTPAQSAQPVGHHPQDIAALLAAMKHLRGSK